MSATPPPSDERDALAAIGGLSAKLGHDMGNAILPVWLRLEAMAIRGMPSELAGDMRAIAACVEHLQRLATGLQLCSFEADRPIARESTDLVAWWADAETLLMALLPPGAELGHAFDADLPTIGVSRQRLTLALIHLMQDAGDAIGDATRGQVRVSASRGPKPDTVCLTVADDGAVEHATRASRSASTGLALARGIVRPCGASIEVLSRGRECTTVTLLMPSAPIAPTAVASEANDDRRLGARRSKNDRTGS